MTEPEGAELSRDDALAAELAALDEPETTGLPEPEPVPEPAPQPAAAEAPAQGSQVPLSTLLQERQRRKDVEARLLALEQQYRQPQPAPVQQPTSSEPALPTAPTVKYEENPAEWLRQNTEILARKHEATERTLQEKVAAYEAEQQQAQQQAVLQHQIAQLDNRYRSDWAVASEQAHQARNYFAQQFMAEQAALGADMMTANDALALEERRLAYQAYVNDLSPVDLLVARASARGYRQAAPTAAAQPQPAAPAPAAQAAPAAAQQADRAARQQQAARTLSNASGGATPSGPTLRDIANLSRENYAKWRAKNPDGFERVMGKTG